MDHGGNEKSCTLGFNPTCDTLYNEPHGKQNRHYIARQGGLADFVIKVFFSQVIPRVVVLCETFEASHLRC